ncbi:MAG: hypothetical protein ACLQGU_02540 [bacterium]
MGPVLDYVSIEVRYGSGYLYFDRCGQCILDIERECPGWIATSVTVQLGILENATKSLYVNFNNERFSFTAQKASKLETKEIAKEITSLWTAIRANFGLEEFIRIGFRSSYLLATESVDEAENRLKRSKFNLTVPEPLLKKEGYAIKNRALVVVLAKDHTEYRVELNAITRHEGLPLPDLLKTDPRLLSKRQKDFRLARMKQVNEYSANPMFAVSLNVDCAKLNPETVSVEEFFLKQTEVVEKDFLPFLGEL